MTEKSPHLPPTVLAARRRRQLYNERQCRCEKVYPVVLNLGHIDKLIDAGLLTEREALGRQKVAEAIVWLIDMQGGENESADGADSGRSCTKHRNS